MGISVGLDLMILMDPFKPKISYDSMIYCPLNNASEMTLVLGLTLICSADKIPDCL